MLPVETTEVAVERPLDPVERISESLFGLIMVLTFTCSISAADPGREEVRTMLFGAIGCNLAWGVIDAIMYLMACLAERGHELFTLRAVRAAATPLEGQRILAGAILAPIAAALRPDQLESVRQHLSALPEPPARPRLGSREWLGALGVFLWVFSITFPVALPFVFLHERQRALRFSNLIAVALLFVMGRAYGKAAGLHPWWTAVVMVLLGGAMVAATIALGG
ncbi:MAG: VIT1/CCC1 transporter family protein [Myxococcales bacterium]